MIPPIHLPIPPAMTQSQFHRDSENSQANAGEIPPITSPDMRFDAMRALIKGLIMRYIRRYSARLLNESGSPDPHWPSSSETLFTSGVIPTEPFGESWLDKRQFPPLSLIENQLQQFQQNLAAAIDATAENDPDLTLAPEWIQTAFQLSDLELLLLCTIAAPQCDHDILRLCQFATGLDTTIFPAIFYAELLSSDTLSPQDILQCLAPQNSLCLYSLVKMGKHPEWKNQTPPAFAPVCVPNRIADFIAGYDTQTELDCALIFPPHTTPDSKLLFDGDFQKQTIKKLQRRKSRTLLIAPRGYGRRSLLRQFASSKNTSLIEINLNNISPGDTPEHLQYTAGLWFREARLTQAIMIFRCDNAPDADSERLMSSISAPFSRMLDRFPGTVCILADNRYPILSQWFGTCAEIHALLPSQAAQPSLWEHALSQYMPANAIHDAVNYVATSYRLTMGEILNTIHAAQTGAPGQPLNGPLLAQTLRATRGQALAGLADLKSTPLSLKDIVLPENTEKIIHEILNYAKYAEFVSNEWEFSKMSPNAGLSVLFSGLPGTGKTLTAGVLAHELKRALYVIDLSRVVDKFIGETEKKLAKIFDCAQKSQAILLFDEADALFAKRTNVKSSNDRYANIEVNYLLQRLESYPGMSILTTNNADSLDDALARRIQFKVFFGMPDIHERAKLWNVLLPQKARAETIDFHRLAENFEMSGGHIKNAAFRACIHAAATRQKVTTEMLWDAAILEYREMGHAVRDD